MRGTGAICRALAVAGVAAALVLLATVGPGQSAGALIEPASVSSSGLFANNASTSAAVSADGRFVAFSSDASNLVPNDTNARDVFVRDRLLPATELVSVASGGGQANRPAFSPAISGDGRYVAFQSEADNLVPNDTNGSSDVFLHDRQTGVTERVSVASHGEQGDADSITPSISGDGRYVTFTSRAANLVPDDLNADWDVFLHDRDTGATELVSIASDGAHGNLSSGWLGAGKARISSDGRFVVFGSFASNLVADDTNASDDIFIRDRLLGTTERVSIATDSTEGNGHSVYPDVSDDGRYVVFHSSATNLVPGDTNSTSDVFVRDREAGTTARLGGSQGNGPSQFAAISADGTFVAFQSAASNLVPGDLNAATDIFQDDGGGAERITNGNGPSSFVATSADGAVLAFQSDATDLTVGDTNGATDVFAWGKSLLPPPPPPTATPTSAPCRTPGDVTGDGTTNSLDALFVLQFSAGLLSSLPNPAAADVNEDGQITSIDAALLLQHEAGLLSCLPP